MYQQLLSHVMAVSVVSAKERKIPALVTHEVLALRALASYACIAGTGEEVYEVRACPRKGERPMVNDPVCGVVIYEQEAVAWIEYAGQTSVFLLAILQAPV
jgi:hypothetical protein